MLAGPSAGLFAQIDKCIYCGVDGPDLTDEHVVPLGLLPATEPGIILRKASCVPCAAITSKFEQAVLRDLWLPIRAGLKLRSRKKRDTKKLFPILIERDGKSEEVFLPAAQFPAVMIFPTFALPGCISGEYIEDGININGTFTIQVAGPSLEDVGKKLRATKVSVRSTFHALTFERLLCKVAYGFAVTQLGLANIDTNFVVPIILGQNSQVGHWLGYDGKEVVKRNCYYSLGISLQGGVIHCRVRLFASFGAPEYHVVVGMHKKPDLGT